MSWNANSPAPPPSYGAAGQMLMGGQMKPAPLGPASMQKRMPFPAQPAPRFSLPALLMCIICPWLVFTIVLYARGMWLRYTYPGLSLGLAGYFLICVAVVGVMTFSASKDSKQGNPVTLGLAFVLCLGAWLTSFLAGDYIFTRYTQAYYDLTALNSYPSVNPTKFTGAQLMDAGIVTFEKEAKLDLKRSIGFKDDDVYCVAPITMAGAGTSKEGSRLDFWAVGINCCSGHSSTDFQCGEYNRPDVHSGLRLMHEDQKAIFRLAVKEAEAAYNIEAPQPIFLHWLSDPVSEVEAYQDDANWCFMFATFGSFGVLVSLIVMAGIVLHWYR